MIRAVFAVLAAVGLVVLVAGTVRGDEELIGNGVMVTATCTLLAVFGQAVGAWT